LCLQPVALEAGYLVLNRLHGLNHWPVEYQGGLLLP